MKAAELLATVGVGACCAVIAYQAALMQKKSTFVSVQVLRVVDDANDIPVVNDNGQIPRPYSVLVYQPNVQTCVMPGVAGFEGETIRVNPDWLE